MRRCPVWPGSAEFSRKIAALFAPAPGLRAWISILRDTKDLNKARTLELFNKTNPFNITGAHDTLEPCHQRLAAGCRLSKRRIISQRC